MSPVPACLCLSCVWVGLGLEMPPNTSLLVCKKRASRPRIGHLNMIELQIVAPSLQSLRQLEAAEAQSRHHTATPTPHSGQAGCRHPDLKGYDFYAVACEGAAAHPGQSARHFPGVPSCRSCILSCAQSWIPTHPVQVGGNRAAKKRPASNSGWETSSAHTCRAAIA